MNGHQQYQRKLIVLLRRAEGQIRVLDRSVCEMLACSMETQTEQAPDADAAKLAGTHISKLSARYG